jgi:hypothetical protein
MKLQSGFFDLADRCGSFSGGTGLFLFGRACRGSLAATLFSSGAGSGAFRFALAGTCRFAVSLRVSLRWPGAFVSPDALAGGSPICANQKCASH